MVTTRTPKQPKGKIRITPEIMAAFCHARRLYDGGDTVIKVWEEDGGQRREYLEATKRLHLLLKRKCGCDHHHEHRASRTDLGRAWHAP